MRDLGWRRRERWTRRKVDGERREARETDWERREGCISICRVLLLVRFYLRIRYSSSWNRAAVLLHYTKVVSLRSSFLAGRSNNFRRDRCRTLSVDRTSSIRLESRIIRPSLQPSYRSTAGIVIGRRGVIDLQATWAFVCGREYLRSVEDTVVYLRASHEVGGTIYSKDQKEHDASRRSNLPFFLYEALLKDQGVKPALRWPESPASVTSNWDSTTHSASVMLKGTF